MSGHPILDFLGERLWALLPSTLDHLQGLVLRHVRGIKLDASEVQGIVARRADGGSRDRRPREGYELRGNVAVIPLRGVIAKYASQVNGSSQPRGTAAETVLQGLRNALDDDRVAAVLLNVDSPGGTVSGVPALGEEVAAATKPIWAHAQDLMASAAYWVGSQAGQIYASRAADIGSIGVYAAVIDDSRQAENEGVRVHVVRAGEHKGIGMPGAPVEKADLAQIQRHVDETRDLFVEAVAAGRGMDEGDVRALATGDTWRAHEAQELGLIDGVRSFEETLAALQQHVGGDDDFDAQEAQEPRLGDGNREDREMTQKGNQAPAAPTSASQPTEAQQAPAPSLTAVTLEQLQAANPQLVEQLQKTGAESERARIAEIHEAALPGQEQLAEQLIQEGATPDAARKRFLEDLKQANVRGAKQLLAEAPEPVGADPKPHQAGFREPARDELAHLSDEQIKARAAADWASHKEALKADGFWAADAYEGHLLRERAVAQGQVL